MKVICPQCRRAVGVGALRATDIHGNPVMDWHYQGDGRTECYGSTRSVEAVIRNLEEELE